MPHKRKISDNVPFPNWGNLVRPSGLTDEDYYQRWLMLTDKRVKPNVRDQMLASPNRKLIPVNAWEDLVEYAIQRAILKWDPTRAKRCPLKNYAWQHLSWVSRGWWLRNKHLILDEKMSEQMTRLRDVGGTQ